MEMKVEVHLLRHGGVVSFAELIIWQAKQILYLTTKSFRNF